MTQGVPVLRALMNTLMFKHGILLLDLCANDMSIPNTIQAQIRQAISSSHAPLGLTVVGHMRVEVSQQDISAEKWLPSSTAPSGSKRPSPLACTWLNMARLYFALIVFHYNRVPTNVCEVITAKQWKAP